MFRRREDWAARMVVSEGPGGGSGDGRIAEIDWEGPEGVSSPTDVPEALLLMRTHDGERDLLVAGPAVPILDADERMDAAQARVSMAVWRQKWLRVWRQSARPRKLLEFFGNLSDAETEDQVREALAAGALQIVGGHDAGVGLVEGGAGALADGMLAEGARFTRAGLIGGDELVRAIVGWPGRLPLTDEVSHVAHVPLGCCGVLFLTERRSERIFEPDDWEVLIALAEQGDRALQRVRRARRDQELALTDPLTGLANRRQMDVVMQHAWAAAERGEGLAVIMLDLDDFKRINDTRGHCAGDEVLSIMAESLRQEARGADAVVRYGGDEFLVIMPRGDAEGALALAARLRQRLAGRVEFTAGVACHQPGQRSPRDLVEAADQALYAERLRYRGTDGTRS